MEKYRDASLPFEERAEDLVSRMTLEEKISQLTNNAAAIPRLGIPSYNWWNEGLHGVARAGTATVFPQSIALAAVFDEELAYQVGKITAEEGRAKYDSYQEEGDHTIYKGLTFWSPNVNIFRDPRWGRGQETYGEDPYLTSRLGVSFIKGLQGNDPKYLKAAACAKHFAVHSGPEPQRHDIDAHPSRKDLNETYLPAFEACVKEGNVESVMGSYNRIYGQSGCGSEELMVNTLRGKWGFKGHYVSDCGAIRDFYQHHGTAANVVEAAALGIRMGCDVNCGTAYDHVGEAVEQGLITEEQVDACVKRLMVTRMKLGLYEDTPQFSYPYSVIDCEEHRAINLNAARRAIVMLKNDGTLPLNRDKMKSIAVVGPNAASTVMLCGNYHGTASDNVTILDGIRAQCGDTVRLHYAQGSPLYERHFGPPPGFDMSKLTPEQIEAFSAFKKMMDGDGVRISEAVSAVRHSDVTVLCLGLDETIEGEEMHGSNMAGGGDNLTLSLPAIQQKLLEEVLDVGKPVVVITCSGSEIIVDDPRINAHLQAFYPGSQGGKAIAEILFGETNPSGRLPITFYRSADTLPDFCDYAMKGRTYRYLEEEALYPFGYGLSYTSFTYSAPSLSAREIPAGEPVTLTVQVKNTGSTQGDEVAQVYIKDLESSVASPNCSLCAFQRVSLAPGEERELTFTIPAKAMELVLEDGSRTIEPGRFTLSVGGGQPDPRTETLTGQKIQTIEFSVK